MFFVFLICNANTFRIVRGGANDVPDCISRLNYRRENVVLRSPSTLQRNAAVRRDNIVDFHPERSGR